MIRLDESKFHIEFDENAINELKKYQQKEGSYESGGILIGEIYLESSKVIVKEVIFSKKAKRSYLGINIDKKEMQKELDKLRKISKYTMNYLGDWHSHPEPHPAPSFVDNISYKITLKKARIQTNFIIFLIIGNHSNIHESMWIKTYFIT